MKVVYLINLYLISFIDIGTCFTVISNKASKREKIYGGSKVSIESMPYYVYLKRNRELLCGGALVTYQHVLTAGHCVTQERIMNNTLQVVAGTGETYVLENRQEVERISIHPNFTNTYPWSYDIAVLKLKRPFSKSPKIMPIPLSREPPRIGEVFTIAGLGMHDESEQLSTMLKAYKPHVVNCTQYEKYLKNAEPQIVCHHLINKKTGFGDSGNPVVNSKNRLACIHSATYVQVQSCTNIYHVLNFIMKFLNE